MLAAVTKVPAITKLLSDNGVTVPLEISEISYAETTIRKGDFNTLKDQSCSRFSSLNYFKCPNSQGSLINQAMLLGIKNKTYDNFFKSKLGFYDNWVSISAFYFDGPNKKGNFVSCLATNPGENRIGFFKDERKMVKHTLWTDAVWTVALSDGDLVALSSISTKFRAALFRIYAYRSVNKTNKVLFLPRETEESQLNLLKESTLSDKAFHAFTNLSFLTEDLLLGRNQHGQLYLVEPRCDKKDELPIFHHLTAHDQSFSSVKCYALDSYDKNYVLLIDNTDCVRIAKIKKNLLVTKKIRNLDDIKTAIGNTDLDLTGIRIAGNVCYIFFENKDPYQEIYCQFSLIKKQLSPKDKLDLIKNNYRHQAS